MSPNVVELIMDRLRSIETRMNEHGREMRNGFATMSEQLANHAKDDQELEQRVLTMELDRRTGNERRHEEQGRQDRRNGVVTTLVTIMVSIGIAIGKIVWDAFHR